MDATQIRRAVLVPQLPDDTLIKAHSALPEPVAGTSTRPLLWVLAGLLLVLGLGAAGLRVQQQMQIRELLAEAQQRGARAVDRTATGQCGILLAMY